MKKGMLGKNCFRAERDCFRASEWEGLTVGA